MGKRKPKTADAVLADTKAKNDVPPKVEEMFERAVEALDQVSTVETVEHTPESAPSEPLVEATEALPPAKVEKPSRWKQFTTGLATAGKMIAIAAIEVGNFTWTAIKGTWWFLGMLGLITLVAYVLLVYGLGCLWELHVRAFMSGYDRVPLYPYTEKK